MSIRTTYDIPWETERGVFYRMSKTQQHETLCKLIHQIYCNKNAAYGDSFGDTYKKLGLISAVTRIQDKNNRLLNLATHPEVSISIGDESLKDTLLDMANYCLMTVMEIENESCTE